MSKQHAAALFLVMIAALLTGCNAMFEESPAAELIQPEKVAETPVDDGLSPALSEPAAAEIASERRMIKPLLTYLYSAAGNLAGLPAAHGRVLSREELAGQWVAAALRHSAETGDSAVIIDKSAFRLYLIQAGAVSADFPIELGANPVDDKRMEGDMTTPEGTYRVVDKRDKNQTKYYRGFLLDYPNDTDRAEFRRMKQNGDVPVGATIGGGIMLHGLGSGKVPGAGGENWTHGCIALSNDDMDAVFPFIKEGTRVVIVSASNIDSR